MPESITGWRKNLQGSIAPSFKKSAFSPLLDSRKTTSQQSVWPCCKNALSSTQGACGRKWLKKCWTSALFNSFLRWLMVQWCWFKPEVTQGTLEHWTEFWATVCPAKLIKGICKDFNSCVLTLKRIPYVVSLMLTKYWYICTSVLSIFYILFILQMIQLISSHSRDTHVFWPREKSTM